LVLVFAWQLASLDFYNPRSYAFIFFSSVFILPVGYSPQWAADPYHARKRLSKAASEQIVLASPNKYYNNF
jgi:hypothetical protein